MLSHLRPRLACLLIGLAVWLVHAGAALARAGGGGGYSTGGASGGGASTGGLAGSAGGGTAFGLFALLVVCAATGFWIFAKLQQGRRDEERRLAARERARELTTGLRDGENPFDAAAFLARVEVAFRKIQRAWSQQDLGPVRAFLSDGVQERFEVQLREQQELGYRNHMSAVAIHLAEVVEVRSAEHFDSVSVRITASATDYRVRLETLDEIPGSRRREHFVEVWSFVRGKEAVPEGELGLIEGCCPSCSAPIDPGVGWRCASCSSRLRGAPRDWVLTEITQQAEWRSGRTDGVAGVKAFRALDPGFTVQSLEDRASVLFWRKLDSERRGSARSLGSVARAEFLAEQARRLGEGERYFLGDCAVGSVELWALLPGETWDRALVEVRWEGSFFDREASDPPRDTGRRGVRRSLVTLVRRAGAQSDLAQCIASAHCPRCGAPDAGNEEGACGWCGTLLNDGQRGWLLDDFLAWSSDEAKALRSEAAPGDGSDRSQLSPRGVGLYAWAVRLALAEGGLGGLEPIALERIARRAGLHPGRARRLLEAGRRRELEPEEPADREEACRWLTELVALAAADGPVRGLEKRQLRRLARQAGLAKELQALLAARESAPARPPEPT
jgi:hypothetical protein